MKAKDAIVIYWTRRSVLEMADPRWFVINISDRSVANGVNVDLTAYEGRVVLPATAAEDAALASAKEIK